jgi:uncharacterized protein (DUF362 family)
VAVFSGSTSYDPSEVVGQLVRDTINALGLKQGFIVAGKRVVLKPNWIRSSDERHSGPDHWQHVITHPAVIESVARWVATQMDGRGEIIICDAPQTDSSFDEIRAYCRLDEMIRRCTRDFPGIHFGLLDLRPEKWRSVDGVTIGKTSLPGDPRGAAVVNLDESSEFVGFPGLGKLYGASYDTAETNERHKGSKHAYMLCRTAMDADVFINLPKLKTHKKVGLTCALKNLVGINANKNWLPHHTEGTPERGGDQFPISTSKTRLEHSSLGTVKRWFKGRSRLSWALVPAKKVGRLIFGDTQKVVRSGNWYGNDTCWRMVLDLNKCLFFFDGEGQRRQKPLRYLAVVDGIIAGEGNGPMAPDPKSCGVILAGTNPLAVDCVAATLMGFDWQKLPVLRDAFEMRQLDFAGLRPGDVSVVSNRETWSGSLAGMREVFHFRPHFGWVGAIEKPE